MAGHDHDYSFGNKKNWRRWAWNRISECCDILGKNRDSANVLYLAGRNDFDSVIAKRKGFNERNLIAVEGIKSTASDIRARKRLCIYGDVFEACAAVHPERKIDVLHLDLCGGLYDSVFDSIFVISLLKPFRKSVISVNMLRGRDAGTVTEKCKAIVTRGGLNRDPKNRGTLLATGLALNHFDLGMRYGVSYDYRTEIPQKDIEALAGKFIDQSGINKFTRVNSYRSGFQTFDSVVLLNPMRLWTTVSAEQERVFQQLALDVIFSGSSSCRRAQAARNSAVFAHQTMRGAA